MDSLRFGCCSDTHGDPLPEFPSDCQLVLHAGDLYDFNQISDPAKAMRIVEQVAARKVVFVRGNHDVDDNLKIMATCDISGKLARVAPGLWLAGIGMGCGGDGIMTPSEAGLAPVCAGLLNLAVENMKDGDQTILLTHYPARLPGWKHEEGFYFDCVFQVCQALRPVVVVQGHTHREFGRIEEHDGMKFVWPGPDGRVLDVGPDGRSKVSSVTKVMDKRKRG